MLAWIRVLLDMLGLGTESGTAPGGNPEDPDYGPGIDPDG